MREDVGRVMVDFTQMKAFSEDPLVLTEGDGIRVRDVDGRWYIDGLSGTFCLSLGHGNARVVEAATAQLSRLALAAPTLATSDRSLELARELLALLPADYTTLKWGSGGSEAVEAAIKMARQYHRHTGDGRKFKVLSHYRAYHGVTGQALAASGWRAHKSAYEPLAAGFVHLHTPDPYRPPFEVDPAEVCATYVRLVEQVIELEGPETIAALITEPILMSAGVVIPPDGYLPALRELCDTHDIVLVFDEIITGFGRTGHLFAAERFSTWPDIFVFGKGLTGGYIALSATVLTDRIAQVFWGEAGQEFAAGHTYAGNPVACAVGLAALQELRERDLVANAAARGEQALERLRALQARVPGIGDVRGQGLLLGLELVRDPVTKEPFPAAANVGVEVREAARRRGLLLRASHWMVVLAPPLTITPAELDELLDTLEEALTEALAASPQALPRVTRSARELVGGDGPIRVDAQGVLWVEDRAAPELAEEYGTPLYVTSEAQIRANVRRLREAFESCWPRVTLLYATKSNANLAIRRVLVEEGVGGDCFGLGELSISLKAGVPPELLVLNGSNKQDAELRAAVETGVTINVDHPTELEVVVRLAEELDRPAEVCLRVLPFSYASLTSVEPDLAGIVADTSHDKWGMDRQTILEIVPTALASDRLRLRGLHLHVSRLRPTPEAFELAARLIAICIAELDERFGWQPEVLDFGGGFPHERDPESGAPAGSHPVGTPEEYAEALTSTLRTALAERSLREPHLLLEPGRRLVSNATVLLTRVGVVKRLPSGSTTWVNVDASTNHCPRVALQGYHYEIVHATKGNDAGRGEVSVVGPTCVVDLLGERRALPPLEPGDLLAVLDVGGYAEVLSSQFNLLPRPATVLVNGDACDVIRRRETLDDLQATQAVPARLA